MRKLLESGVHFGHQTRRWNPKMKRFIFTERNGIYIIDLRQTLDYIEKAYDFIRNTVAEGGTILFVGTKKQAQEAISGEASRVGMPYVNHRWLGGMLTNFQTVYKRLQRMKELESIDQTGVSQGYTKKETLQLQREKDKLTRAFDLLMLVLTGAGRERTRAQFETLFARAGLRLERDITLPPLLHVLEVSPVRSD